MADVGRNGREGVATLAICLIETSPSQEFTAHACACMCVCGISVCDATRTKEEEDTSGGQYMPRLYYIRGGGPRVHTRVRIPGGRLLFPRSYLRSVFRRHICDWIQTGRTQAKNETCCDGGICLCARLPSPPFFNWNTFALGTKEAKSDTINRI